MESTFSFLMWFQDIELRWIGFQGRHINLVGHLNGPLKFNLEHFIPFNDNGLSFFNLGQDDGLSGGSGYLLGALNTQTSMTILVSNSNKSLEPGTSGQPESASALAGSLESHPLGMCPGKS